MSPSTPDEHADDLHRIIQEIGRGRVDLFASSGGAVNALALAPAWRTSWTVTSHRVIGSRAMMKVVSAPTFSDQTYPGILALVAAS